MTENDAPAAPPGWYSDPARPGSQRYWDGSAWAATPPPNPFGEQPTAVSEPGVPLPPAPPPAPRSDPLSQLARQGSVFWFGVLACVLMVIGGLGTWATALSIVSISGTRGDGWLVVAAAVAGICALWGWGLRPRLWLLLAAVLFGAGGAATSGVDLHKIAGVGATSLFGQQVQLVHPAWGIYMALGASVALAGFALALSVLGPDDGAADEDAGVQERSSNAPIIFVTVLIAVGAVVAVSKLGTSTQRNSDAQAQPATTSTEAESTARTTPTVSESSANSQEVQSTLDEYASDYSEENANKLSSLLASSLVRRDGAHAPEDLSKALATYRTQFSQLEHPIYKLSEPQITTEEGGATAKATYTITSQNGTAAGAITFHLVRQGTALTIDKLTIEPNP